MADLPPLMQLQIDIVATKTIFSRITLFRFFPMEAILLLVQRVQPVLALPNEIVLKEGQEGIGLFFIVNGKVMICKAESLHNHDGLHDHGGFAGAQAPTAPTERPVSINEQMVMRPCQTHR